jgi:hypothetical protein
MDSMLDSIMGSLQTSGGIGQISESLGLDQNDVTKVMSGVLPALVGGLTRNTSSAEGASGLLGALDRDHDGSIMDDLAGLLVTAGTADTGAGILGAQMGASALGSLFKVE